MNRISKYYDPARGPERAATPRSAPRCRTVKIGHREPHEARMSVCDVLGAICWGLGVLAGLAALSYVLGIAFGAGFRLGCAL